APPGTGDAIQGSLTTGTEDLLLNRDIVEALLLAASQGKHLPESGDDLGQRLQTALWQEGHITFSSPGKPVFDHQGNRRSGTGEHVAWLRPRVLGDRVQPGSTLEVWTP